MNALLHKELMKLVEDEPKKFGQVCPFIVTLYNKLKAAVSGDDCYRLSFLLLVTFVLILVLFKNVTSTD